MLSFLLLGAAAAIQDSGVGSSRIFLVQRVMALQAEQANSELNDIASELDRMLDEKRQLQSLYEDLVREQDRLVGEGLASQRRRPWRGAAITSDQRAWASTLPRLCPPGSERRNCLTKALTYRLDVLKARPTP